MEFSWSWLSQKTSSLVQRNRVLDFIANDVWNGVVLFFVRGYCSTHSDVDDQEKSDKTELCGETVVVRACRFVGISNKSELIGGNSYTVTEWTVSGGEIENCSPVIRKGATYAVIVVRLLADCKNEAGVSSSEAGLEGLLEGGEVEEGKVTTEFSGIYKPEGSSVSKSSSVWEKTEKQSSLGGKIECTVAKKKNRANLKRLELQRV